MSKNIVLLFDGTWNKPSEFTDPECSTDTNVRRFYASIHKTTAAGQPQDAWYNQGVGTRWWNTIQGGVFGHGLDEHVVSGYEHLCKVFEPECKIYLLGFSRGAYTARSLIGMIRKAGILRTPGQTNLASAYALYRARGIHPNAPSAQRFRDLHSYKTEIHFVGVWDTVGALGIPLGMFKDFNVSEYGFHDTKLSKIVRNAFHALALDEHRAPYSATLWGPQTLDDKHQRLEQSWFAGAHADVGGGYARQPLSNPPLRWMQQRALQCGLELDVIPVSPCEHDNEQEHYADITDSFAHFLGGVWAATSKRNFRRVGLEDDGPQRVHWTLADRLEKRNAYRPVNIGLSSCITRGRIDRD